MAVNEGTNQAQEWQKFLNENEEIKQIKLLPGVIRIDIEFYKVMGAKGVRN